MRRIKVPCSVLFFAVAIVAFASGGWAAVRLSPGDGKPSPAQAAVAAQFSSKNASLQSPFIRNDRQLKDESVKYYAKMAAGTVFVTGEGIVYSVFSGDKKDRRGWSVRESLLNAREAPVEGLKPSPARVSYFKGNDPSRWRSNIPAFEEVGFRDVYEGVSLRLRAFGGSAEKIFEIDKGGDPEAIAVKVEGALGLRVNAAGELEIETGLGTMRMTAPLAYQECDGKRTTVKVSYRVSPEEKTYGFLLGEYNRALPLVIDPSLLASTYIGGGAEDLATAIALARDGSGDILIAGYSNSADYPSTPGAYQPVHNGVNNGCGACDLDIFVSRFNADLTALRASTFLGGTWALRGCATCNEEMAYALSIDPSGNIYVSGRTDAEDFPVTPGAYRTVHTSPNGLNSDGFISRFNSDLSGLLASTYFGGWNWDGITNTAIDGSGRIYVTGWTGTPGLFPEGAGYDTSQNGRDDAFVAALDPDLTMLMAGTYLGGSGGDGAAKIALDGAGNVFVTGSTDSADFPTLAGAFDETYNGQGDVFVSKLDAGLKNLLASTYLGGANSSDGGADIAVDGSGAVFLVGTTVERSGNDFPVTAGAFDTSFNGGSDVFVSKFDSGLNRLLASTYIGGYWFEGINSLVIDSSGNIFIAGSTGANEGGSDFPTTPGAYNTTFNKGVNKYDVYDAFISKFNSTLSNLLYSTFIGGTNRDNATAIALDSSGKIVIAGNTNSSDYPTTTGAYDTTWNGGGDVFVSKLEEPKTLAVDVIGPKIVNPGQEVIFLIRYKNGLGTTAENGVITFDFPKEFTYVLSTGGGIYRNDWNQVFWKLGDLPADTIGFLEVKLYVPWGLPNSEGRILANMGAKNARNSYIDIDGYLNYSVIAVLSHTELTEPEINAILASNPKIKQLYDLVVEQGYLFHNTGVRTWFSDDTTVDILFFIEPKGYGPAYLINDGNVAFLEEYSGGMYKKFDIEGGYQRGIDSDLFLSWGAWSETHSPSVARCLVNCTLNKVPNWALSRVSETWKATQSIKNCTLCAASKGSDRIACAKCAKAFAEKYKKLPGVSYAIDVAGCVGDCLGDPNLHVCTEDKKECGTSIIGWLGGFDTVYTTLCNKTTGTYAIASYRTYCTYGDKCVNGACINDPCKENPASCQDNKITVSAAHDPNAKSADFKGNVIPGQTITYTIEYENTGSGTAFEVYVTDELDADLDELTLVIHNNGTFSPTSRILSWDIGTIPPCDATNPSVCKGTVSFSAKVKSGLPSGTEIINYAEVHFPSANEITPTNPVLNMVRAIAADPKTVETTAETAIPIALTGKDSGSNPLTYRITSNPLYGTLEGTTPNVTYTPMKEFNGQDELYYVVNNGVVDSDPARIVVKVDPNPADAKPPTIISTYPKADSINVHIDPNPVSIDPLNFIPTLSATLSEPIDSSTITTSTFTIEGITGTVYYDEQLRTAYFTPSTPLSHSTTYTVHLTTGIKDKVGNPMTSGYSWQFTTESPANISMALPDNLNKVYFGGIFINSTSSDKVVNITSTGSVDLKLNTITVRGVNEGDFKISEDNCSGRTLNQFENCTVKLIFQPSSSGTKNANLSIPSNDQDTSTLNVPISGEGVIPQYTLNVDISPAGGGGVTGTGISCPGDCTGTYNSGENVTLTANANSRYMFSSWTNCDLLNGNQCIMTMDSNKNVTANFISQPYPINLLDPSQGHLFDACSYYDLPAFQWETNESFKGVEVQFSLQDDFSTTLVKVNIKKSNLLTMKPAIWKRILFLPGSLGGTVYWRVVGTKPDKNKTKLYSDVFSFVVEGAEDVGNQDIMLTSISQMPILMWENNCNTKFKVWFASDTTFIKKNVLSFSIKNPNDSEGIFLRLLTSSQWGAIMKLVGYKPGETIYWYVESWDGLKRYSKTDVMSFSLED